METKAAVKMLAGLAQESRLQIFRLLVKAAPEGVPAGVIAETLDLPNATCSFHLAQLLQAGLLECEREGRSLRYAVRTEGMQDLLRFLSEDCCQGRPELCAPVAGGCCSPEEQP